MLFTIDGVETEVFIAEFDIMPKLPITWNTEEERPWALALQAAIQDKIITEPGKYALAVSDLNDPHATYSVYTVKEQEEKS